MKSSKKKLIAYFSALSMVMLFVVIAATSIQYKINEQLSSNFGKAQDNPAWNFAKLESSLSQLELELIKFKHKESGIDSVELKYDILVGYINQLESEQSQSILNTHVPPDQDLGLPTHTFYISNLKNIIKSTEQSLNSAKSEESAYEAFKNFAKESREPLVNLGLMANLKFSIDYGFKKSNIVNLEKFSTALTAAQCLIMFLFGFIALRLLVQQEKLITNKEQLNQNLITYNKELIDLNEQLELATQKAESGIKAKNAFFMSMNHELRTPLNAIMGFTELIKTSSSEPDTVENCGHVLNSSRHLLSLIQEMLDLASLESGSFDLSIETLEAHFIAEQSLDMISILAKQKNVKLEFIAETNSSFLGDAKRSKQILINLLSNSIKYNKPSGGSVTLKTYVEKGFTVFEVSDTGIGISEDNLKEMFNLFTRFGQEHGSIEGSGIGLVVVKKLVDLMDGKILCESKLNVGTTFKVMLPFKELAQPRSAEISEISEFYDLSSFTLPSSDPESVNKKILYVDDIEENLIYLHKALNGSDYEVFVASNASEAFQILRDYEIDLIILDIHLPDATGIEIKRQLNLVSEYAVIPTIAYTACNDSSVEAKARSVGFSEYLIKPLGTKEIRSAIEKATSGVVHE